jgi:hypothetical protein
MGGKRMTYNFKERLEFSQGARQDSDKETIQRLLDGCQSVSIASTELDRIGVDYIAKLRRGAEVYIDAKTREPGCSRYWRGEPELAIEIWSVIPGGRYNIPRSRSKAGWTLDEGKVTDLVLYVFDKQDSETAYLLPFQPLRMAARRNGQEWMGNYKTDIQNNGTWESMAVFVPASVVIGAVTETFSGVMTHH